MTESIMRSICTQEQRTWVGSNLPDPSWCISLFLFGQLAYLYTDKSGFIELNPCKRVSYIRIYRSLTDPGKKEKTER